MKSLVQRGVPAVRLSRGKLSTTTGQREKRGSGPAGLSTNMAAACAQTESKRDSSVGIMTSMNNDGRGRELQSCLLFVPRRAKHAFQKNRKQKRLFIRSRVRFQRQRGGNRGLAGKQPISGGKLACVSLKSICAARPGTPRLNSWNVKSKR